MHTHVESVLRRLDEAHTALRSAIDLVPPAARTRRTHPDRWSASEVLEHISLVEAAFTNRVGAVIAAAVAAGLQRERAERTVLPDAIAAMLSDRSTRREAAEPVRPTGQLDSEAAWTAVERTRDEIRAMIVQADGLALSAVAHAHPFFGTLTVYQWVELIAAHRDRHAMQIREIAAQFAGGS